MPITKDQWSEIEAKLKRVFAVVKFTLGRHTVTVSKEWLKENRLVLVVYIDGTWCGAWMNGKDDVYGPLVQQLWRKRERSVYTAKDKADFIKIFGRRAAAKHTNLHKKIVHYTPDFSTAASLVRQFKKVQGLELAPEAERPTQ